MKKLLNKFYEEIRINKTYIFIALLIMIITYTLSLVNFKLTKEDGLFEYLSAFALLIISIVFLLIFFRTKRYICLLIFITIFFFFGEEISWGQRIIGFKSPEYFIEHNFQHEFNIHNLKIFTPSAGSNNEIKKGIMRYSNFYMLFLLTWIVYGILLPLLTSLSKTVRKICSRVEFLIPPLSIGLLFLINYMSYKIIFPLTISNYPVLKIGESYEFVSAVILLLISLFLLRNTKIKNTSQLVLD